MKAAEPKSAAISTIQKKSNTPFFDTEHASEQESPFFAPQEASGTDAFFQPATRPTIQTKLTVGQPNDKYEQEADNVADKVVQRLAKSDNTNHQSSITNHQSAPSVSESSTPIIQHKTDAPEEEKLDRKEDSREELPELQKSPVSAVGDDEGLQMKCAACEAEEDSGHVQMKGNTEGVASNNIESQLNSSKGGGSPLPNETRTSMESAMGADFSNVRVHTGSNAVQMSQDLNAQAFTHGSDVYFNEGKYNPSGSEGGRLLAHELTHTVQQGVSRYNPSNQLNSSTTTSADKLLQRQTINTNSYKTDEEHSQKNANILEPTETNNSEATNSQGDNNQSVDSQSDINKNDNLATNNQPTSRQNNTFETNSSSDNYSSETIASNSQSSEKSESTQSQEHNTIQTQTLNNDNIRNDEQGDNNSETYTSTVPLANAASSSSNTNENGGSGFATYDLFLTFIEAKKQTTTEYFTNQKKALTDGINEEKRKTHEVIETELNRLIETKKTTLEKIRNTYTETKTAITTKRDTAIQNARDIADSELAKINEIILTKKEAITSKGEDKAQSIIGTGDEQSRKAQTTTETQVQEVDNIIRQKSMQYGHKDNAADIINAAWESQSETVQKIREGGTVISSEVTKHAEKLAGNYREDANNIASKFNDNEQEAKDKIIEKREETIKAITEAATESTKGLDQETTNLIQELESSVASQVQIIQQLPAKVDKELDEILTITLTKVGENEANTLAEIDKFKEDISDIYWYSEEVSEAQKDLDKAIAEHYTDVDTYVKEVVQKVGNVTALFQTQFKAIQDRINPALSQTGISHFDSAEKLKTETIDNIDNVSTDSETQTKTVSQDLEAGLQVKIDESDIKWSDQLASDINNMESAVNQGLEEQAGILSRFSANLDKEFNRSSSWWDDFTDFISGMASGFWEGFTSLLSALWDAMGTLIFWIVVLIIVLVIVFLVVVVGIALAVILKVLLVIGIVVGLIAAIYYFYRAFATEGLTPYERGRLFGRGLFELAFALIGTGVYARLLAWIPRIGRIAQIVARVGSWSRFIRIVIRVKNVRAFLQLLDRVADIEKLLQLMDKIKDIEALIKLLSTTDDIARVMEVLLAVDKADDLLRILNKADDIAQILRIIEKGISLGNVEKLITILAKTKELSKLIMILGQAGDDFARIVNLLEGAADIDKMIIAMARVGAANLNKLVRLLETVSDIAALLRIVTKATNFESLLRIIGEATEFDKLIALFDKVQELDKLVTAFDNLRDVDRLLTLFDNVIEFNKLVSVLGRTTNINKFVTFLEGITDINKAIPVLERLGAELDDFVRLLDEPGMTIANLEKLLYMENLTVPKLRNLLSAAGGRVDDLINVLEEIKDLDKLINYINHFGNFVTVKNIVDKAKATNMTIIGEFMEACYTTGFKKETELFAFFDKVFAHGSPTATTWREVIQYGRNFVAESAGRTSLIGGRNSVGSGEVASKSFILADGTSVNVTLELMDIEHMASRHTWRFFVMTMGNVKDTNSMWAIGTDMNAVRTMAIDALNSAEVQTKISTMVLGANEVFAVGGNEVRIALNGPNGLISMYPSGSGVVEIPQKLMQAAVRLWKSL